MTEIKYKSREATNPKGKARVYFTCHKDDFALFFDEISDEILKKQNCVIYYYDPEDEVKQDDLLTNLSQMQLIVIPITTKFLCSKNRALDVEFKYACEHHIPVLPLMQENGLEEMFNVVCGELQTLNKNVQDSTAVSYDEKLDKFLDAVLVSDELAEKIRLAFDAYIFLSYRKKDRKYAQELMKLIHKNEFCRDIAIWYDEFLVPGENFNVAIEEALKKSELFTLLVTPNLINEENYVMSIEYPMARNGGKQILPVESVKTDKKQLKEKFQDIDECIKVEDETKLTQELLDKLHSIAIKENDTSPEHNFFIGLAYLSGIDVEIDHEKALALITMAANEKLPEAIEKLVHMYCNGEGAEKDQNKAIEWLKKLCEIRENKFSETLEYLDGVLMIDAYENLGNIFFECNQLKEAENYYYKIYNVAVNLMDEEEDEEEKFTNIVIERAFSELSYNDFKKMVNRYKKNNEEINAQKEMLKKAFLKCSYLLAIIDSKFGRHDSAAKMYNMTLFYIDKYAENSANEFEEIKYLCYVGLSDIYYEKGQWNDVFEYRKKSIGIIHKLVEKDSSEENLIKLSEAYDKLGDACYGQQMIAKAQEFYLKALHIREKLLSSKESNKLLIARSYYNLSWCHKNEQANEYEYKALEILLKLAVPNGMIKAFEDITYVATKMCETLIGNTTDKDKMLEIIEKYYIPVYVGCEGLSKTPMTISSLRARMNSYRKFSCFYIDAGEYQKALSFAELALKCCENLSKCLSDSQIAKEDEYLAHIVLADVFRFLNNVNEAKLHYDLAWGIIKEIAKNDLDNNAQNARLTYDLACLLHSCGSMLSGGEQAVYYVEAHKNAELLCKHFPKDEDCVKIKKLIEHSIRNRKK